MKLRDDITGARPLVSVLVPSFNAQHYLAECLESALNQTYPGIEIIVVDDGSKDGSLALARSFERRGVRVIAQENRGQSGAYNAAFSASRGDFVQYLDADDILDPRKIEVQVARLAGAESTAIASGAWGRFRSSVSDAVVAYGTLSRDLVPVDWLVESWSTGEMMHVAGWLIPRRVAVAAGPWVEERGCASNSDADFFTRVLLASTRCLFCVEAKSY